MDLAGDIVDHSLTTAPARIRPERLFTDAEPIGIPLVL